MGSITPEQWAEWDKPLPTVAEMIAARQLSKEAVLEYKKIYEEDFGEEISVGEAREIALNLLSLYSILLQPLPHERATPPTSSETTLPDAPLSENILQPPLF